MSVAVLTTLALSGCAGVNPGASPSATPTPSGSTDPWGKAPDFFPEGTAVDNKPLFDWVLGQTSIVWAPDFGVAMVNDLAAKGFNKAAMQLTPSVSGTGKPADQIVISVQFGSSCLIGQRMLDGAFHSSIESALAAGGCIIGKTRKIDW